MFRLFLIAFAVCFVATAQPAGAQSMTLDQAEAQGLVGEQQNGYLGVVKNEAGVQALVDDINLKRRQLYKDIARKNGISLSAVETLAGEKAISKAQPGELVQGPNGNWIVKQ